MQLINESASINLLFSTLIVNFREDTKSLNRIQFFKF